MEQVFLWLILCLTLYLIENLIQSLILGFIEWMIVLNTASPGQELPAYGPVTVALLLWAFFNLPNF